MAEETNSDILKIDQKKNPVQYLNQKIYDSTNANETQKKYLILSSPRTGSTYISRRIASIKDKFGMPNEYLHKLSISNLSNRLFSEENKNKIGLNEYLDQIKKIRTTPDGYFGLVAQPQQLFRIFTKKRAAALKFINSFDKVIFICRKDKVGQAVSQLIASKTGTWFNSKSEDKKVIENEDFEKLALPISRNISQFILEEQFMMLVKNKLTTQSIKIDYLDILEDKDGTFLKLLKFISDSETFDIEHDEKIELPEKPQDELTKKLKMQYLGYIT